MSILETFFSDTQFFFLPSIFYDTILKMLDNFNTNYIDSIQISKCFVARKVLLEVFVDRKVFLTVFFG